jgi:hypothetical protein
MQLTNLRISGVLLFLAGLLFGTFMFFHPANTPQGALEPIWVPVHCAWFLAYLLLICSFIPLYAPLVSVGHSLTNMSYWLAFLSTVLSLPIAVWDSFVIPYLAKHAPDFIAQIEEISLEPSVLVFRIIVFLTVFMSSLGFLLFGLALIRTQVAPVMAGVCLAVGAPLFWIGALFVSKGSLGNLVTEVGALLFGVGLILLGYTLLVRPLPMIQINQSYPPSVV